MKVWIDGVVCDDADARVSPFDHGLLTGDGVFETLKVYAGTPFAVRRHLERLSTSAAGLGLDCPDEKTMRDAMDQVVAANGISDGRIRVTVTGGEAPLGSDRGPGGPLVIVAVGPIPNWAGTTDVVVVPWVRNERGALVGLKTTSYGENVVALAHAKRHGAGEAIFANTVGNLCEGTGTNVFCVVAGLLVTPPLSSGCLAGVTRGLLLEVTDAVEDDLPIDALTNSDEAFLTSSTREVQPIRAVDDHALPASPGAHTKAATDAFTALVSTNLDP